MKPKLKSPLKKGLALAACLLSLGACDTINNIKWPHVYGSDEVPQSVRDEPRAVATPPVVPGQTYPRLGDVPSKPNDFTPQGDLDMDKQQMENDRAVADRLKEKAQESSGTPALLLPPAQPVP